MVLFQRKLLFSKISGGVQHFPSRSNYFQGWGFKLLIPIETYTTCDFRGRGPDLLSPSGSVHVNVLGKSL